MKLLSFLLQVISIVTIWNLFNRSSTKFLIILFTCILHVISILKTNVIRMCLYMYIVIHNLCYLYLFKSLRIGIFISLFAFCVPSAQGTRRITIISIMSVEMTACNTKVGYRTRNETVYAHPINVNIVRQNKYLFVCLEEQVAGIVWKTFVWIMNYI